MALVLIALPAEGQVFDSQNVVLLSQQDQYAGYNDVWGFLGADGHEYVILGTTTGTSWWDVDDPVDPVEVAFIAGPSSINRDMSVIGDHAYVGTDGGGGIQIVDISDPANPALVGSYTATVNRCHNIFGDVDRQLIFASGGDFGVGGLQVLDASSPLDLVQLGSWQGAIVHDVSGEGTRVYVSLPGIGQGGSLLVMDVSDPANPVAIGTPFPDPSNHSSSPFGDMAHIVIAAERSGGHIKILDLSDVDNPVLVDEHDPSPTTTVHNPHIEGSRLFCAWNERGTRIYDVSDPANIAEIGYFDTFPDLAAGLNAGNWGVYPHLPSGLIAASDRSNGLFLMRYDTAAAAFDGVIESSAGGSIDGASVDLLGNQQALVIDSTGAYRFTVDAGVWQVSVSAYGHLSATVSLSVGAGATTTTPIVLTKLPSGGVGGRVTDQSTGSPLEFVELVLLGTPFGAVTDANGDYSFPDVPTSPSPHYELEIRRAGYGIPDGSVTLEAGVQITRDFELSPPLAYVDFSDPSGWTVTNDVSTTAGFWEFGEPKGTYLSGNQVAPELDHTPDPENQAAVTGNASGGPSANDVDGGATRVISPVYDLSGTLEPHLFFYRWYSISEPDDSWQTHVTTNSGLSWTLLEAASESEPFWKGVVVDLTGVTGSAAAVQFRFTCEDQGVGQLVEGALDDFTLFDAAADAVSVSPPDRRIGLSLSQSSPNPLQDTARISFAVPQEQHVLLSVFDVAGRHVSTLVDGVRGKGAHVEEWDGREQGGRRVAAGIYFYELRSAGSIRTRKMVVLR